MLVNLTIRVITLISWCYMYDAKLDWTMQMVMVMIFKYELTCLWWFCTCDCYAWTINGYDFMMWTC